jgi:hypothetical protein
MTNSFLNKVSAEREIISYVNQTTKGRLQLTGLSTLAISSWHEKNSSMVSSEVVLCLLSLSDLCQRLSDRSHETFEALDEALQDSIAKKIMDLKLALNL